MQALPTLGAILGPEIGLEAQQPQPGNTTPPRVTKEMLDQALATIGLEFKDEHKAMMLPNVNRTLAGIQTLRKLPIPLDTEPAFSFHPALPGKELPSGPAHFVPSIPKAMKRPASVEDLAFAPAAQLGHMIRARHVTSTELTRMYLDRLKRYGPKLNCVITLTEDLALEQAAQADKEIRAGRHRGPLHGVPYGAKDLFATKGIKTTWGAEPYQDQVIDYDATVIRRLREAGAVLLAKLSMGALAQGDLWFGGLTKNPWNLDQGSSGSSAGSASSTAAGLVGFAIGTETLGSIVSPSSRCGCAGLRPTYGRISRYGAMGLSWTMDKVGPIARSIEDCALVLHAAYGPDQKDSTVTNVPFNWHATAPIAHLKIGFVKTEFDRVTGDRKKLYDDALEALRKAGANLQPVDLPASVQSVPIAVILSSEAATAFDDITRDGRVETLKGQQPSDWPNAFRSARLIPAVEYIRAQRARTLLMQNMDKFMADWDVLVTPAPGSATLGITNFTGHPQACVPCGFTKNNDHQSPQSIMFTGRIYEEGMPLRVALAYEENTEWHTMHPEVNW